MTTPKHRLSPQAFTDLAHGLGDAKAVRALQDAAHSRHLQSIVGIIAYARKPEYQALGVQAGIVQNMASLNDLQERHPITTAEVLSYPQVGAWANSTLRDFADLGDVNPDLLAVHLAHLGDVVAAIALLCGEPFDVVGSMRRGKWRLPGLGSFLDLPYEPQDTYGIARFYTDAATIVLPGATIPRVWPQDLTCPTASWRPLPQIHATCQDLAVTLTLDDISMYAVDARVGERQHLTATDVNHWQDLLKAAWNILVTHHRPYAEAISQGVKVLVPLMSRGNGEGRTATMQDAFGSMMLSAPADPLGFAETLVHEYQHGKLGAVDRLYPLSPTKRDKITDSFYAPWRDDPRPVAAAMQGIYAFAAVTDFWRVQCAVLTQEAQRRAQFQFSRWHKPTLGALDRAIASGELTPLGVQFFAALRDYMTGWDIPDMPEDLRAQAQFAALDHQLMWLLRNAEFDLETVEAQAQSLIAGQPYSEGVCRLLHVLANSAERENQARHDLICRSFEHPAYFAQIQNDVEQLAQIVPGTTPADAAYLRGNFALARQAYLDEIKAFPLRVQSWAGLALCSRQLNQAPVLQDQLALTFAIHKYLVASGADPLPSPDAIAAWLTTSIEPTS